LLGANGKEDIDLGFNGLERKMKLVYLLENPEIMTQISTSIEQKHPGFELEVKVKDILKGLNSPLGLPSAPTTSSRGDTVAGKNLNNDAFQPNKRQKTHIDMTKETLMEHIKNCQQIPGIAPNAAQIHTNEDKAIDLQSRQKTLEGFTALIAERRTSLSEKPMGDDRTKYPMAVFSGMKGLGKTRMLEEWKLAFEGASITSTDSVSAVIVSYGNCTGLCQEDDSLPIAASFGWRMLHRLFVLQNSKNNDSRTWASSGFLPTTNAEKMTLPLALQVIQGLLQEFGEVPRNTMCCLFIGIDEYQNIPKGNKYESQEIRIRENNTNSSADRSISQQLKEIRKDSNLWMLIEEFQQCRGIPNLQIYPAFAGTKFGVLRSVAESSVPETRRLPLSFLTPQGMEDAIRSGKNGDKLVNDKFRRELFFLGGLPRPSIAFASARRPGADTFSDIWSRYVAQEWRISSKELLLLVAYAISRQTVSEEDKPGIQGCKWYALADQGLCLIEDGVVTIPYCVFRLAATVVPPRTTLVEKCMVQNLKFLVDYVDKSLSFSEPWQYWEYFGAAFFALRVNSIIRLMETTNSNGSCTSIPFKRLCEHAVINGCTQTVDLFPMEVLQIHETLSPDLKEIVTTKPSLQKINWVRGDTTRTWWGRDNAREKVTYCVLNGTGGKGVDIFCALKISNSSDYLLYADQRKRVAASLGPVTANDLIQKAAIMPSCLGENAGYVLGLFSLLSSYRHEPETLSENSFVLSYGQHKLFHGCLASHPAASPCIDVNFDNGSTLKLLTSVAKIVHEIMAQRPFVDLEEFSNFCIQQGHDLSTDDRSRCFVYSSTN
jgi:hypothetical protein